jgi:hypothetical protein
MQLRCDNGFLKKFIGYENRFKNLNIWNMFVMEIPLVTEKPAKCINIRTCGVNVYALEIWRRNTSCILQNLLAGRRLQKMTLGQVQLQ